MTANKTTGSQATVQRLLLQMPQWKQLTSPGSHKVLSRIERCHTADFGYHAYRCSDPAQGGMALCNMFTIAAATAIARHVATTKKKNG